MSIRTTITLEEDLVERVKQESRQRGVSFKDTVNNLLRLALSVEKVTGERKPFKIQPFNSTPVAGLDFDNIQELLDYAEGEDRRW